ncbi:hypothetical protein KR018_012034, partial [Drosophila ironensis]
FDIKLLSGKNVVMVKCQGYESELFLPQIVKGRITFQNVIANRRCCPVSGLLTDSFVEAMGCKIAKSITPRRKGGITSPLAKSTPSSFCNLMSRADKENIPPQQALRTPDLVRLRPGLSAPSPAVELNLQPLNKSVGPVSTPTRSSLLYAEPAVLPPAESPNVSAVGIIQPQLASSPGSHSNSSTSSSSISTTTSTSSCGSSPNSGSNSNVGRKAGKAGTAVRTYSRKKAAPSAETTANTWAPLQKKKKTRESATKGVEPNMHLDVRKRKLIVDVKKNITSADCAKTVPVAITKRRISRKQVSGKTRKQFEALKVTAFDLLTRPSLGPMSTQLSDQFRLACMDRCATTVPSYGVMAAAPPLVKDRQVEGLLAKRKKMERE